MFREKCELEIIVAKAALAGTLELYNVVMGGGFRSTCSVVMNWKLQGLNAVQ